MTRLTSGCAVLVCLTGCASWSTETRVEEGIYQALSVVDAEQSMNVARRGQPEVGPICARVLGAHPSAERQLAFGLARSGLHLWVTDRLSQRPPWVQRLWEAVTIGDEGYWIGINYRRGL